jgi:diacylglycerol kinase
MKITDDNTSWRNLKYSQKFENAWRGIFIFIKTTKHIFFYAVSIIVVLSLGLYFSISISEWISIVLAIALVIISEILNTAIEIDIDLTSPEYHPYARDTKDVAAGAVLAAALFALIIGLLVFVPKIVAVL